MSGGGKPRRGGMASKLANDGLGIEQISDLNDKKRKKVIKLTLVFFFKLKIE